MAGSAEPVGTDDHSQHGVIGVPCSRLCGSMGLEDMLPQSREHGTRRPDYAVCSSFKFSVSATSCCSNSTTNSFCCCTTSAGAGPRSPRWQACRRCFRVASASRRSASPSRFASAAGSMRPARETYASNSGVTECRLLRLRDVRACFQVADAGERHDERRQCLEIVGHRFASTARTRRAAFVGRRCSDCAPRGRCGTSSCMRAMRVSIAASATRPGNRGHGAMTTLSVAVAGAGKPRSGRLRSSACQIDSATNGMIGCTSRRMPSSTPTSTRCTGGRVAVVACSRPLLISMYQSQNSDQVKS